MRRHLAAALLGVGTLALAGCQSEPAATPPSAEPNPSGLTVADARLILPAVAGNPGAAYFELRNEGPAAVVVNAADIADAGRTEMHDMATVGGMMSMVSVTTLTVPRGGTVRFAPGGKHVMAFDLSGDLRAGATTELTLTVASGDKASFPVRVEAANAAR